MLYSRSCLRFLKCIQLPTFLSVSFILRWNPVNRKHDNLLNVQDFRIVLNKSREKVQRFSLIDFRFVVCSVWFALVFTSIIFHQDISWKKNLHSVFRLVLPLKLNARKKSCGRGKNERNTHTIAHEWNKLKMSRKHSTAIERFSKLPE